MEAAAGDRSPASGEGERERRIALAAALLLDTETDQVFRDILARAILIARGAALFPDYFAASELLETARREEALRRKAA